jgi:hypothetical protein
LHACDKRAQAYALLEDRMKERTKLPERPEAPMRPADEAPPGTPGSGETVCSRCGGSGLVGTAKCPDCEGTGKVTRGIGGA